MADFFITQGNQLPYLDAILLDAKRRPADLTGATVTFKMEPEAGCGGPTVSPTVLVLDAKGGAVRVAWSATDTAVPAGLYIGEFTAVTAGGLPMTFPNNDYINVRIKRKVGR